MEDLPARRKAHVVREAINLVPIADVVRAHEAMEDAQWTFLSLALTD